MEQMTKHSIKFYTQRECFYKQIPYICTCPLMLRNDKTIPVVPNEAT